MVRFSFFTGDCNFTQHGGKWLSNEQEFEGGHYFLGIELTNWEDATGEPGPGKTVYNLSLVIVPHPLEVEPSRLSQALNSCGPMVEEPSIEMMVAALWDYGTSCPVREVYTCNWRAGMQQLKKTAGELDYKSAMERPVNRIGSTGRECMEGDFISAIARGLQEGRKDAWVLAKIHGAKEAELVAAGFQNPFKKEEEK